MGFHIAGLLLFGQLLASCNVGTGALNCYECVNEFGVPHSTPECDNPGPDLLNTCEQGTLHCLTFEGTTTRPYAETISGVIRLCGPPTPPEKDPENICYCDDDAADWLKELVPMIAPSDLIAEGAMCFCDEDACNHSNSTDGACPQDADVTTPNPAALNATEGSTGFASSQPLLWLLVVSTCFSLIIVCA